MSGENFGKVTNLHPSANFENRLTVNPYMWKNGKTHGKTSWCVSVVGRTNGVAPVLANSISQFVIMLVCVNSTPFGNPVVPEEYGKSDTSSGFVSYLLRRLKSTSVSFKNYFKKDLKKKLNCVELTSCVNHLIEVNRTGW